MMLEEDLKSFEAMVGFALFCIAVMFGEFLDIIPDPYGYIKYVIWILSIIITWHAGCTNRVMKINKKVFIYLMPWFLFILIYILVYNRSIYKHSFYTTFRWLYYFSFVLLLPMVKECVYPKLINVLKAISGIYVFGVYFFLIFPYKYRIMRNIWGYWPTGTDGGTVGYHAGFANHYSENAMYIVTTFIIIVAQFLVATDRLKKRWLSIQMLIVAFALVATTKRAHVLFGVVALICAYYLFKPEKRMTRSFKILLASAVGLIVLYLLSFSVPEISAIFERFSHIGSDEESNTRFMMWALALKNFKENPLIGIGWNGYKYQFYHFLYNPAVRAERYAYLNAHNVYLQLLCETGILGFLIFMSGAIELFVRTLKLLKKNIRDSFSIGSKGTIFFVLTMQIFFWLYSLTGNCLYDTMFGFYSVSIGFVLGYLVQKKNIKEEIYNEKDRNINIS